MHEFWLNSTGWVLSFPSWSSRNWGWISNLGLHTPVLGIDGLVLGLQNKDSPLTPRAGSQEGTQQVQNS